MSERVNHPDHYGGGENPYECIKVLEAVLGPEGFKAWLQGTIIKYLFRAGKKDGPAQEIEDYKKAAWYANYAAEFLKRTGSPLMCFMHDQYSCGRCGFVGSASCFVLYSRDGVEEFTCRKCYETASDGESDASMDSDARSVPAAARDSDRPG